MYKRFGPASIKGKRHLGYERVNVMLNKEREDWVKVAKGRAHFEGVFVHGKE